MGIFDKIGQSLSGMVGGVDKEVLQTGRPAQAELLQVVPTGTTVEIGGGLVQRVCLFTVKIAMDGVAPYQAQVKQRIPELYLARLQPGLNIIAAKVHPQDPQRIVLDFDAPPPAVRAAATGDPANSAAYVLANGDRAQAVIVASTPINRTNQEGLAIYAFTLTVIPEDGRQPYQIQVGNPVPPQALPLIYPGSKVPVRLLPSNPNAVVIDWAGAMEP